LHPEHVSRGVVTGGARGIGDADRASVDCVFSEVIDERVVDPEHEESVPALPTSTSAWSSTPEQVLRFLGEDRPLRVAGSSLETAVARVEGPLAYS
jgi:hypothetical protein